MQYMADQKGTGLMEDYTYDLVDGLCLGAHMLEVSPQFAATKPEIQVHPLGIGGKSDPARLVFEGIAAPEAVAVSMIDMGDRCASSCRRSSSSSILTRCPICPSAD